MRSGFRKTTVDEVCEQVSVGIVIQPSKYYVPEGKGVRAFRSANVLENRVKNSDWVFLSHEGHLSNSKSILKSGDVLVVRSGAPGTACVVPPEFEGSNCIDIVFARPKRDLVEPDYLCALTNSSAGRKHILEHQGGLALKHFNVGAYKRMQVILPPLQEQRKIAAILRTWDEAIEKVHKLRRINIARRQWLRTEVLSGRRRLPGYSGAWRVLHLNEVLREHRLKCTGDEPVFSVSVHKGLVNQIEHLGRSFAAQKTTHYNRVLPGDIVYTKSPTGNFPLGIIKQNKTSKEVIVSPLYGVFTPSTPELGLILDTYFESPVATTNYLRPLVQKGAKNTIAITNSRFLQGQVNVPLDPAEQAAIAALLEAQQTEFDALEREIEALYKQKRGLMEKLLTGEWRVAQ